MELLPEVEVWWGLPAVRAALAAQLKQRGMTQKAIAQKLGIAESAVSQYLSGKRGGSTLPADVSAEIVRSAARIEDGDSEACKQEVMRLLSLMRETRAICKVHKQHTHDLPEGCELCFD